MGVTLRFVPRREQREGSEPRSPFRRGVVIAFPEQPRGGVLTTLSRSPLGHALIWLFLVLSSAMAFLGVVGERERTPVDARASQAGAEGRAP